MIYSFNSSILFWTRGKLKFKVAELAELFESWDARFRTGVIWIVGVRDDWSLCVMWRNPFESCFCVVEDNDCDASNFKSIEKSGCFELSSFSLIWIIFYLNFIFKKKVNLVKEFSIYFWLTNGQRTLHWFKIIRLKF